MGKKVQVGKFYEKRGDDYFVISKTEDGRILEIEQWDAIRHMFLFVNFFAESAPKLIAQIQKAAGIKPVEVEYEYAVQRTSAMGRPGFFVIANYWGDKEEREEAYNALLQYPSPVEYKLVRRRKAGEIEDA